MSYEPGELDVLSCAFHSAIEAVTMDDRDVEATKAVVMSGILDAAQRGERRADKLKESALASIRLFDQGGIDAAMPTTPL